MQKYYCERCRVLYNQVQACENCGTLAEKKIWIEVHYQSDSNRD